MNITGEYSLKESIPISLNKDSSMAEIEVYAKSLNKTLDALDDINTLFAKLNALVIDSYSFTYCANLVARNITKSFAARLNDYLEAYEHRAEECKQSYAFIAYYLLAYYYREYEDMTSLEKLVVRYDSEFAERYALSYQIRGRLRRRQKGKQQEALECDQQAMRMLKEKNIENIGVDVTYASTVSLALENNESFIHDDNVASAIDIVKQAIQKNQRYSKYNYLLAKLLMFDLLRNENEHSYEECIEIIMETKELLRKAIELEDSQTEAYASQVVEFKSYMRQADWILSEIRMIRNAREQAADIEEAFQRKFDEIKEEVDQLFKSAQNKVDIQFSDNQVKNDERLRQMQDKYMEILALFVSVVSVIIVVIGMFSNKFSSIQIVISIIIMNACVVAVYSVFLVLLKKVEKKYIITLFISCLIVVAMMILVA